MMKTAALSLLTTVCLLALSPAFAGNKAGEHGCCVKDAAHTDGVACNIDYASLGLTSNQKSKIQAWQTECTKAGCTKESRRTFLKQAEGILSAEQYAKLKRQCEAKSGKTQA